jgi:capsular polysaccharide biosynthesis protein
MIMGGTVPPPWLYVPINQKVNKLNYASTQEIIFLSREDAQYRKLLNESELLTAIKKEYAVKVYEFSRVSYVEQVRLMNTARVVIQMSGTHGINNLYINPKHTKVIILSPEYYTGRGTDILKKLDTSYKLVRADHEETALDHNNNARARPHNNFTVDIDLVMCELNNIINLSV